MSERTPSLCAGLTLLAFASCTPAGGPALGSEDVSGGAAGAATPGAPAPGGAQTGGADAGPAGTGTTAGTVSAGAAGAAGATGSAGAAASTSGAGGAGAAGDAGTPQAGGSMPSETPPQTDPPGQWGRWRSFGGDLSHTRTSAGETRVSTANVADMNAAFRLEAPGVTATPAVDGGVVYWADWGGIVHATRIVDQRELWRVDKSASGGGYTGSPALTDRLVYVANRNGLLSALDRDTGEEIWSAILDAGPNTHIWSSPIVVEQDGVLIIGVGGLGTRDNGRALPRSQLETFHGWVEGFDALTGHSLWRFDTSAAPDYGAGVSVWSSAAVDPGRKLAFIGTGNNYYGPVSPYSDSLLAIDYLMGELAWHHQFTPGDAWTVGTALGGGVDGDVGAAPNLFTIADRDVVGVGDKPGDYHVLDRETGEVVWSKHLTAGGFQGGVMAPAAQHDGVIYVVSNNGYTDSTVFALNAADGETLWTHDLPSTTFGGPALGNGVLFVGDQQGHISALEVTSGGELWTARLPQGRGGGFALVDGMLFSGYGFHFSESAREPLLGGLTAYSLSGTIVDPIAPTDVSDCDADWIPSAEPTFTNVYQSVICATGCGFCHGRNGQDSQLDLHPKADAYLALVDAAARGKACDGGGHVLVRPGDPDGSLLYQKIAAMPACGDAMPPGDQNNSPVTAAMIARVRAWISAGAADD